MLEPHHGFSCTISSDYAHFRHVFTHSFFETLLAPPKTSVTGIFAAALGYDEKKTIQLNDKIMVGVEILELKGFAREIVTIVNLKSGRIEKTPTLRNLIIEPKYRLYIACKDFKLVSQLRDAITQPVYPLYLGISECLATVKDVSELREINPISAQKFRCIVPDNKIEYNVNLLQPKTRVILPRIYKTTLSYTYTPKGRKPTFIDLIMFYNCELDFKEPLYAFEFDGKVVVLF